MRRNKRGTLQPHQSSIVINLAPVLAARNITYTTTYLMKIGINNVSATKLIKGKAVQINLNQLTLICLHLNCTPNDLFALRDMQLPPNHALHALKPVDVAPPDINKWLVGKSIEEITALLAEANDKP
jgi:DNA-binding Xre family transcriptional regulator